MTQAQAQRLRVFNQELEIKAAWQSYWVGKKVQGHRFLTYDTGVIKTSNTGDSQTLDVSMPATAPLAKFIEEAYENQYIWETEIIQFDSTLEDELPPFYITVAQYVGQIESATSDGVSFNLTLGSSLNPIGAQVPPRRFTTDRIGTPLRL